MIELEEYRGSPVELSADELVYLLRFLKTNAADDVAIFEAISPTSTAGTFMLRPGPFVGRMGIPGGRTLDIRSRFSFEDTVDLLRESGRLPLHRDRLPASQEATPFLVETIARAFAVEVERIVGRGLAKGYEARLFVRPPYPGQPDVTLHLGRFAGRADRLVTRARRISIDVDVNKVLALALDVLRRVPIPHEVAIGLARLVPVFSAVRRKPFAARDIGTIPLTNLTKRYEAGLALAEVVLRGQSLAPRTSNLVGRSLMFHMPKVWEDYVAKAVERAWGPAFEVTTGHGFPLTDAGEMTSIADVIVRRHGHVVALYDAKYKRGNDAPTSADVYQMVTYCRRLGLRNATLVYPSPPIARSVAVRGVSVHIAGIMPGDHTDLSTLEQTSINH